MIEFLGALSGLVALAAFVPYIWSIIAGQTRPSRVTWFTWSIVQVIETATFWESSGNSHMIWASVGYVAAEITVAILSLKYGVSGKADKTAVLGIIIALSIWIVSGATQALLIILVVDAIAAWPTIVKSKIDPESEDLTSWVIAFTSAAINLVAVKYWGEWAILYPLYLLLMTGTVIAFLLRGRRIS